MLGLENYLNKSGSPFVLTALLLCLCDPGGGLELFRRAKLLEIERQPTR